MLRRWIKRFARDRSGVSAVEFALIAPVLVISLIGVVDTGYIVYQRADMESALRSGVQYFMNGGDNLTTAVQVVNDSWTTKPQNVIVTAERFCMCGAVVHACNVLCDDGTYPLSFNRLNATAVFPGILIQDSQTATQSVRVR